MVGQYKKLSQYGFTVVELVVVIVILGILMSLAVVNVSNSQVTGRDTEREEDAQAIARHLENIYANSIYGTSTAASYPGIVQLTLLVPDVREGLSREAVFAPGVPVTNDNADISLRPATTTSENPADITPKPGRGLDIYVYQPFKIDNTLCENTGIGWGGPQDDCIRFNLYYWHEATNTVRKITSRNQ